VKKLRIIPTIVARRQRASQKVKVIAESFLGAVAMEKQWLPTKLRESGVVFVGMKKVRV